MTSTPFDLRALEIHGGTMWSEDAILRALELMEGQGLNTLVFHDGDVINQLVFPRTYFPPYSTWSEAPPRRGENAIYNARAYIRGIGRRCRALGVTFMLEVKELGFTDEVLERYPDLIIDGIVCPTHPRWNEYLDVKYAELFEDFPDIAGVIVSVGSPEGRAALSYRRCGCSRCATTVQEDWYRSITASIHGAASRHQRRLIVREFSYSPADQQAVLAGLDGLSDDIELCVKPYARDFYPTYPDNPALSAQPQRRKWLEYDVHGQFYGWGVLPCPIVEDQARRFRSAANVGATALLMRAEWERINDLWCLQTFNRVNIATGALLARDPDLPAREALAASLRSVDLVDPSVTADQRLTIADALLAIWPVVEKSMYVRGYVFNNGSMIPDGVHYAWWNMTVKHKLQDWDPSAAPRLDVTDTTQTAAMLAEKDAALEQLDDVLDGIRPWVQRGALRIPDPCRLGDVLAWSRLYLSTFARCAKLVILAAAAEQRGGVLTSAERVTLRGDIEHVEGLLAEAGSLIAAGHHSHQVGLLSDVERITHILDDARITERKLANSTSSEANASP